MIKWLSLCAGFGLMVLGGLTLLDVLALDATGPHLRSGSHAHLSLIGTVIASCADLYLLVITTIRHRRRAQIDVVGIIIVHRTNPAAFCCGGGRRRVPKYRRLD